MERRDSSKDGKIAIFGELSYFGKRKAEMKSLITNDQNITKMDSEQPTKKMKLFQ